MGQRLLRLLLVALCAPSALWVDAETEVDAAMDEIDMDQAPEIDIPMVSYKTDGMQYSDGTSVVPQCAAWAGMVHTLLMM